MWISGMHRATHCLVFARTHGRQGDAIGITAFFVPKGTPGKTFQVIVDYLFLPELRAQKFVEPAYLSKELSPLAPDLSLTYQKAFRTNSVIGFIVESYEWTFNMPTDHASEK